MASDGKVDLNIQAYFQQWLKVSGNFSSDWSWFQDRLKITCHDCHAVYTTKKPENAQLLDWELQEWVKKHSTGGPHDKEVIKNPMDVVPLTGDFKALPMQSGQTTGNIDVSSIKAQQIKDQMKKYKMEIESENLDKKIEWLKNTKPWKIDEAAKQEAQKAKQEAKQEADQEDQEISKALLSLTEAAQKYKLGATLIPIDSPKGKPKSWTPYDAPVSNPDFTVVNGEKIFWKKDALGKIIGVITPEQAAAKKTARITKGRRFR
jgi:hypothetical protein